jgi:thiamine-phosphate pyrophosphorylase
LNLAQALATRAEQAAATFIVNDRADIAAAVGASGLHVGQDDLSPAEVRPLLPPPALIGVSTHNRQQIEIACGQPVDYIAIGPVFSTRSKKNPDPVVGLEGVREAVTMAGKLPVVAIGGIAAETAPAVLAAGAASVAIISDLLVGDPAARIRTYLALLAS